MPRLQYPLIHAARQIDPLLVPLLRVCRDLPSAQNELRWLREHVASTPGNGPALKSDKYQEAVKKHALDKLVAARGRGQPLQYLLRSEYFGDLELLVRPGVLIPRRDTASAISHLASLLRKHAVQWQKSSTQDGPPLSILDLCTGTGCIPLLLQQQLELPTTALGIDISPIATSLSRQNFRQMATAWPRLAESSCYFAIADIMIDRKEPSGGEELPPTLQQVLAENSVDNVDVMLSNPPYISPLHYRSSTERSVRNFEPELALVPPALAEANNIDQMATPEADQRRGDSFYPRLLHIASSIVRPQIFWCEVGDLEQAKRVAAMAVASNDWHGVQIWRDEPAQTNVCETVDILGKKIKVVGEGHGRSVICWRPLGRQWLGMEE